MRFAEIAGGRDGDFGGIDGDTCGFALGGTAGADQGGVDGGFGIIRAGVNGEAIAWFQEGITDGLAVFATEFGFGDEAEAEGTGSGDLQQEFFSEIRRRVPSMDWTMTLVTVLLPSLPFRFGRWMPGMLMGTPMGPETVPGGY